MNPVMISTKTKVEWNEENCLRHESGNSINKENSSTIHPYQHAQKSTPNRSRTSTTTTTKTKQNKKKQIHLVW